MKIILDAATDFPALSTSARKEIIALLAGAIMPISGNELYLGIDMTDVADLTYRQVEKWMEGASQHTKDGLRVVAEYGPVFKAKNLTDAEIYNIGHFQSRTTIRTRTITGDSDVFLFGWDDWHAVDEGEGRYAVTPITHRSLRRYFRLDPEGQPAC